MNNQSTPSADETAANPWQQWMGQWAAAAAPMGMPGMDAQQWMKALDPESLKQKRNELQAVSAWLSVQVQMVNVSIQTLEMQISAYETLAKSRA
jgi:hypothetical protein